MYVYYKTKLYTFTARNAKRPEKWNLVQSGLISIAVEKPSSGGASFYSRIMGFFILINHFVSTGHIVM